MPQSSQTPSLAQLTHAFFGGAPPAQFTPETVSEAMRRQIVHCHAMIARELEETLEPPDDIYDAALLARDAAYERIDRLAETIVTMMRSLEPPPPPAADPDVKRHALKIEVERRAALPLIEDATPSPLPPR